jgi:glycosyltransferase involved in cell wall biosynthesis
MKRRVHLLGWRRDMPAVYAALDVLALTSLNEGTPVSAIEALAAGVPVVGTAVGGMADVVQDGETGLLAPSGDVQALAGAILGLLGNRGRARALGAAGQRDVRARYSRERMVADMTALYRSLAQEKGLIAAGGSA